ncbi:MAG: sigma-54-dependent Fis family transcriptional regulator [Myxococcales bacterium]|nr:MAG: sigma-54-dependent Fis family transcriptional regulator [Myxococcales bacterium]
MQQETERILVVDDDAGTRKAMSRILRGEVMEVKSVGSGREALALLERESFSLVLTDLVMKEVDGLEVLAAAKRLDPDTEVIVITGFGSITSAVAAIKNKAFHYIQKPLHADELRNLVQQALEKRRLKLQVATLAPNGDSYLAGIIGESQKTLAVKRLIRQIAAADSNVLITGESGTGKELVALAIHKLSPRTEFKFLPINCASFTEELLANELFGHERGSFTGATTSQPGLLESANGGTIFFDEVGDMSLGMQSKLLRVIQERELLRVGGVKPISIDVRIIAATNKNLKKSMELGTFREDLYYRLNVVPIRMPALAERPEDIPRLVNHFLERFNLRSKKKVLGIDREAMEILCSYNYPGNVRELENIVEHAASLTGTEFIMACDLPEDLREIRVFTIKKDASQIKSMEELESEYMAWVLEQYGHNKSRAADALGINRASLYRKLKKSQFKA